MNLVSIILPNLNTPLPFLRERISSIIAQTYTSWECIIIDGYSDNGSWEYLESIAASDHRFKAFQYKKEGIYKAWNAGISLAKGEYIYIATSDDTMVDSCIAELADALERNKECDIAHCCLTIIDEKSDKHPVKDWNKFLPYAFFGALMKEEHIRVAPYDGILHCGIKTVYTSIVQLLIRRTLFVKVGDFMSDQGSIADLEWGMRASLVASTIHIPKYLASWRIHDAQATTDNIQTNPETYRKLQYFIDHAFQVVISKGLLEKKFYRRNLKDIYWKNEYDWTLRSAVTKKEKGKVFMRYFINRPLLLAKFISLKILYRNRYNNIVFTRHLIRKMGLEGNLKVH